MTLNRLLADVFHVFSAAGIRWCLLRGLDQLEQPAGDVDLLIAKADLARARPLLLERGFIRLSSAGRASHSFYLAYDNSCSQWIELDLVTELAFGPAFAYQTFAEAACLERRVRDGDLYLPQPEDQFWLLWLHCLLDKASFPARYQQQLQQLAGAVRVENSGQGIAQQASQSELARAFRTYAPAGWNPEQVLEIARQGRWEAYTGLAQRLMQTWQQKNPRAVWPRKLSMPALRLLEKPLLFLRRPGLGVALLGPDGVGKSTLAAAISQSFHLPARVVYMGLWKDRPKTGWLPRIPGWSIATRPFLIWRRYLTAQVYRAFGRLVIFDRYTYDALLPPRPPFVALKRGYFWLLAHSCPAPDLVIILDAPGQLMFERKGEADPERLELERQFFLALGQRVRGAQVVNTCRAKETVQAELIEHIWQRYSARQKRSEG